jgi:RNA polymerase sigma-70 factor (ECF subfamily)
MTGSREQTEDLFQETFKRVYEKACNFHGGNFKNWLYTISTRIAIDSLRRKRRLRIISLNQKYDYIDGQEKEFSTIVADNTYNPSVEAERAEIKECVRQAIAALPAKQRATLVLAYYQQLSYREVAEVMGCSLGTVKTQMYRAIKTLAQKLPDISE